MLRTLDFLGKGPARAGRAEVLEVEPGGPLASGGWSGAGLAPGRLPAGDFTTPSSFAGVPDAGVGVGRREVRGAAVRTGREPRGRTDSVPVVLDRRRLPGFRTVVEGGAVTLVRLGRRGPGLERAEDGPSDGGGVLRALLLPVRVGLGLPAAGPPLAGARSGASRRERVRRRRGMAARARDLGESSSVGVARMGPRSVGTSPS